MTGRARRLWPLLACALSTCLVVPVGTAAAPSEPAGPGLAETLSQVAARPAGDLADSVGVNVHLGYLDTPYRDPATVLELLQDLGVRHVRDELRPEQPRQWDALRTLAAAGVSSDLILGPRPDQDPTEVVGAQEQVDLVARELAGAVGSVEGTNEWDLWGGSTWAADLRTWQGELYDAVRAAPELADVPVLAPSVAMPWNWSEAGSFAGMADRGNGHLYPGGRQPGGIVEAHRAGLQAQAPDLPLVVTESGYHNAVRSPATPATGHPAVPEQVAASYVPRLVADNLAAGVERTYLYELLDQFPDASRAATEKNFGLVRHDLSPKPAYDALRDLLRLTSGGTVEPGAAAASGTDLVGLEVDGATADLRRLVLQRPDGSVVVLLWRDVATWDPHHHRALAVTPAPVTVRLDRTGPLQVQRPGSGTAPVAAGTGDQVELDLGADLIAVVAGAGTEPVVAAPATVSASAALSGATVRWTAPTAQVGRTTGYEVRAAPGGTTTRVGADQRSVRLRGLVPGAAYRFTVTALSASGPSAAGTASATPFDVPLPPRRVTSRVRRGGLHVAWSRATARGQQVVEYEVRTGARTVRVPADRHRLRLATSTRSGAPVMHVRARSAAGWSTVTRSTAPRTR